MIKTNFDHYYIEVVSTNVYKVYSDKTGVLKELKQAPFKPHKQGKNTAPYIQVSVTGCTLLHRLIADTFIAPVQGKTVNHKDGNPSNNALDNLEVVSQKENHQHAAATGLMPNGEAHRRAKFTDQELLHALREIQTGASVKSTAKKYGITQSYLNKVKNKVYRAYLMESLT